jgi:mono/diheme cytochrome c family protein
MRSTQRPLTARLTLIVATATQALAFQAPPPAPDEPPIVVPKLWDEQGLEGWATPLAGLGRPPTHVSEAVFYATPVDNLRSFAMYHPDREPPGYREELVRRGPQPLIEPEKLKTKADWVEAGRIVFESLDTPQSRSADPEILAHFTSAESVDRWRDATHDVMTKDGVLLDYRWVVDLDGTLKATISSCFACHTRLMPDGSLLPGAPCNYDISDSPAVLRMLEPLLPLPDMTKGEQYYAQYGVPWRADDPHARWRDMDDETLDAFLAQPSGAPPGTMFARFNGSLLFNTRMADLRGIRDRRWLDATASHRNRGPEDVARYGLLVEYALDSVFGEHHMLPDATATPVVRPSDEAMYALGLYLYSLEPAPSPHPFDDQARHGQEIFEEEGCAKCHVPPAYTNNKLIAAPGFEPPLDDPLTAALDISNRRVNTDPSLTLFTRKGTGYYKVPSLRGLWYRGLYGHSGWFTSLEEWFDPKRLRADNVPSGWRGKGMQAMAVTGHDFGLDLSEADRAALIAFLKTL